MLLVSWKDKEVNEMQLLGSKHCVHGERGYFEYSPFAYVTMEILIWLKLILVISFWETSQPKSMKHLKLFCYNDWIEKLMLLIKNCLRFINATRTNSYIISHFLSDSARFMCYFLVTFQYDRLISFPLLVEGRWVFLSQPYECTKECISALSFRSEDNFWHYTLHSSYRLAHRLKEFLQQQGGRRHEKIKQKRKYPLEESKIHECNVVPLGKIDAKPVWLLEP